MLQFATSSVNHQVAAKVAPSLGFFSRSVRCNPHPKKIATGGEDAYLATDYVLGVADGVGWWRQNGVDAGQYSEAFMRAAYNFTVDEFQGTNCVPCLSMLNHAYEDCNDIKGSATTILSSLCEDRLEVASIGDCGMMLIRDGEVVYRTEEQTHGLNFPFQLGTGSKDRPTDAYRAVLHVQEGDLVIMGSDGVFDNIFDNDLVRMVREEVQATAKSAKLVEGGLVSLEHTAHRFNFARWNSALIKEKNLPLQALVSQTLENAADEIMRCARENATDIHVPTPFAEKCIESGAYHEGGKQDDMTLVIATIGQDVHSLGERFATAHNAQELAPPYKNWP